MYIFICPFAYTYNTRLRSLISLLSWGVIYFLLLFLFVMVQNDGINYTEIMIFCVSIIIVYNNYEIGYIINDTETIKKEKKPTMRLGRNALDIYESNKLLIYGIRVCLSIVLTLFLIKILKVQGYYIISAWLILPVFIIYNSIRNRLNLALHFTLVTLRYCSPILIVLQPEHIINVILNVSFIFPLPNLIERCSEPRFDFSIFHKVKSNHNKWRVFYYFMATTITGLALYTKMLSEYVVFICCLYMLVYRVLSPLLIQKKN